LRKAAPLLSLSVTASLVTQTQHIDQCLTLTSTHYKELLKSVRNVMNTINVAVEGPSTNNMCVPAIVISNCSSVVFVWSFFLISLELLKKKNYGHLFLVSLGLGFLFFMLGDLVALMLLHMKYS